MHLDDELILYNRPLFGFLFLMFRNNSYKMVDIMNFMKNVYTLF
jgi:hypothetical protein